MIDETPSTSPDHASEASRLLRVARARLDEVADLPDDWDSYGAVRPQLPAISAAHDLLTRLWRRLSNRIVDNAVPWMIAPLTDGGVQLEWRSESGAIEVEIAPTGKLNFLVERGEETIRRSDPAAGASADVVCDQLLQAIVAPVTS